MGGATATSQGPTSALPVASSEQTLVVALTRKTFFALKSETRMSPFDSRAIPRGDWSAPAQVVQVLWLAPGLLGVKGIESSTRITERANESTTRNPAPEGSSSTSRHTALWVIPAA